MAIDPCLFHGSPTAHLYERRLNSRAVPAIGQHFFGSGLGTAISDTGIVATSASPPSRHARAPRKSDIGRLLSLASSGITNVLRVLDPAFRPSLQRQSRHPRRLGAGGALGLLGLES